MRRNQRDWHPKDALGARDLKSEKEAEADKEKQIHATGSKRPFGSSNDAPIKHKKPEHMALLIPTNFAPSIAESLIVESASQQTFYGVVKSKTSTWLPNSNFMFNITQAMDEDMSNNLAWINESGGWNPIYTRIYAGLLYYIQTWRAMHAAKLLSPDLLDLLEFIMTTVPESEWIVPGPLVILLKGISVFNPAIEKVKGDVSPCLPGTPGIARANGRVTYDTTLMKFAPNIPSLIEWIRTLFATRTATPWTEETLATQLSTITHLGTQNATEHADWQNIVRTPGFQYVLPGTLNTWESSFDQQEDFELPASVHGDPNLSDNWTSFLRMTRTSESNKWIANLARMMAKYSNYFHGSTTLREIAPSSGSAGAVKSIYTANSTLRTQLAFTAASHSYALKEIVNYETTSTHVIPEMPSLFEHIGMTTATNALFHDSTAVELATVRKGPFWTVTPDIRDTPANDFGPNCANIVPRIYYVVGGFR